MLQSMLRKCMHKTNQKNKSSPLKNLIQVNSTQKTQQQQQKRAQPEISCLRSVVAWFSLIIKLT